MARVKTKAGTTLTPAEVDALADEAERGYDLARAAPERTGPGRPSLGEGEGESPRITYRVAPALLAAAERRAKAEGRTLSELAREALRRYLAG